MDFQNQNKNQLSLSYYRAFDLPLDADVDKINAKMKNGLLQVKIAKKENANKKRSLKVT